MALAYNRFPPLGETFGTGGQNTKMSGRQCQLRRARAYPGLSGADVRLIDRYQVPIYRIHAGIRVY